ncbi:MAG: hypothetical protein JXJ04_17830 [Spirochaetales bacterium]|nr:hypothetical protein [Spirochaetales bacterium]
MQQKGRFIMNVLGKGMGVILLFLLAACRITSFESGMTDEENSVQDSVTPAALTLLATAEISETQRVQFYQQPDGHVIMCETGSLDNQQKIDYSQLEGKSITAQYRQLMGAEAEIPVSLIEAEIAQQEVREISEPRGVLPAQQNRNAAANPGSRAIDWTADAQWFMNNFASSSGTDAMWYAVNTAWAKGSYLGKSMYYQTTCFSASQESTAYAYLNYWDGSSWQTSDYTLQPRHYITWTKEYNGYFYSGVTGNGSTPRVDYVYRLRYATPDMTYLGNYPNAVEYSNGNSNDMQGIAHDSYNWYVSRALYGTTSGCYDSRLWKVAVDKNLNSSPSFTVSNPWKGILNHFGDIDYFSSYVIVALEKGDGISPRAGIGVFNYNLVPLNYATIPTIPNSDANQGSSCSWVAYNPKDYLIYSSKANATYINAYQLSSKNVAGEIQFTLTYKKSIRLRDANGNPITINHIQGGDISDSGKLYLAVNVEPYAIQVVDLNNGRVQYKKSVNFTTGSLSDEIEGITVWDLDAIPSRHSGVSGQIHMQMINNDWIDSDNYYLKHFRVAEPGKL